METSDSCAKMAATVSFNSAAEANVVDGGKGTSGIKWSSLLCAVLTRLVYAVHCLIAIWWIIATQGWRTP